MFAVIKTAPVVGLTVSPGCAVLLIEETPPALNSSVKFNWTF